MPELKTLLAQANQKAQIIAEAEEAIQQQRTQIITQAEQSMQEQSKLVSGRLSELQQEANSEKAAHEFEKTIREQAQGDLQRMSSQLLHEASLRDSSLAEARKMKKELSAEKAEMTLAQQRINSAFQEGRLLYVKVEKQEAQIAQLIEDNKVANKTIVDLKADIISGASENF